jgi:competence protein ComEA
VTAVVLLFLAANASLPPVAAHRPVTSVQQQPTKPSEPSKPADEATQLPEGEGRDALLRVCSGCHPMSRTADARRTALGWAAVVDDMVTKGAEGSDEDFEAATTYLVTFFAAVDVNHATAKELVDVAGFTGKEAAAIVAYRDAGHAFKSFDDVKKVPDLDEARLTAAKPRLVYTPK